MLKISANSSVVMILVKDTALQTTESDVWKQLAACSKLCVIAIARPGTTYVKELARTGFTDDKLHIIDAHSKEAGLKNSVSVDGPGALTDISIEYTKALTKQHCDAAVLSGTNTFFAFNDAGTVVRFIAVMAQKTRVYKARLIMVTTWNELTHPHLQEAFPFMDEVLDLR